MTREERDTMGVVQVPKDKLWGAQTQRSRENFCVGIETMPKELIHSLALVKKASAIVNAELGLLSESKKELILSACEEILHSRLDDHFPLVVWQTGSGTQTNMNVNEVIANFANLKAGGKPGSHHPIHPNDDVNKSQSSNDVIPTAITVAVCLQVNERLIPALRYFAKVLYQKVDEFKEIAKCGRTHLMDATPLTLGQEFSAFLTQIENGIKDLERALIHGSEIALGGTAVGTGLNTHPEYACKVADQIATLTKFPFKSAPNKFEALGSMDGLVALSGALRTIAVSYMKIANDIRLLGSGPRCGLGELRLPENEPGSSIMPGKVNPTQCEMMTQVAVQVMGNDVTVGLAGSQGHLQLNVFRPVVAYNLLQSIRLLSDAANNFVDKCLIDIKPNIEQIRWYLENSLMLVTALNPHIGYENAAKIAKYAFEKNLTLKEAALVLDLVTEDNFDKWVDPHKMLGF
jgi:fumarate hydratase class II